MTQGWALVKNLGQHSRCKVSYYTCFFVRKIGYTKFHTKVGPSVGPSVTFLVIVSSIPLDVATLHLTDAKTT